MKKVLGLITFFVLHCEKVLATFSFKYPFVVMKQDNKLKGNICKIMTIAKKV